MIDRDGKPLTDPKRANEGLLVPIGDYKGYGLSLIIGLLAGHAQRAAFGRDVVDFVKRPASATNTGHAVLALVDRAFAPVRNSSARSMRPCAPCAAPNGCRASSASGFRASRATSSGSSAGRTACQCPSRCATSARRAARDLGIEPLRLIPAYADRGQSGVDRARAVGRGAGASPARARIRGQGIRSRSRQERQLEELGGRPPIPSPPLPRAAKQSCSRCSAPIRSRPWSSASCCRPWAMAPDARALCQHLRSRSHRAAWRTRRSARVARFGDAGLGLQRSGEPRRRRGTHRRRSRPACAAEPVLRALFAAYFHIGKSATADAPSSPSISFSVSIGWRSPRGWCSPSGWGSIRAAFLDVARRSAAYSQVMDVKAPRWCAAISLPKAASPSTSRTCISCWSRRHG